MIWWLLGCGGPTGWDIDQLGPGPHKTGDDTATTDAADTDTDTDSDADSDTDSDTDTDADTDTTPDPCLGLAPTGDPAVDHANIDSCLATRGHADLAAGTFTLTSGISVPAGASVTGAGTTLRLTGSSTNYLVTLAGDSTLRGLVLDGNDQVGRANGSVLHITGSHNRVSDLWIGNAGGITSGNHTAGIYFIDDASSDNLVSGVEITETFYGIIFVAGLGAGSGNSFTGGSVHETWCDGVTFAGYGELTDSTLYHSGFDCENGPIPGASVYCLDNEAGGLIARNTMYDDCGNIVDIDTCGNFTIEDNDISDPGYDWGGWAPWCSGAGVGIIDSHGFVIQRNIVENNERPQNRLDAFGDPNGVFSGAGSYSDVPAGGQTIVAFWLGQRESAPGAVTGNVIDDNAFRAACSSGCSGLGYFSSRGTGKDSAGNWDASTTNYHTGNDPFGSNYGSWRCGSNWYAANSSCTESASDADCNTDDYQHTDDWLRTDSCADY